MKLFALALDGKLVGFTVRGNGDDPTDLDDTTVELDNLSDNVWVSKSREVAERVAMTDEDWYNSCLESPKNPYIGQLKVVEFGAVS